MDVGGGGGKGYLGKGVMANEYNWGSGIAGVSLREPLRKRVEL